MAIDLHIHSINSDGTDGVEEIVDNAIEMQLEAIDAEYKGKGQWPGGETDPDYREHIRIKQAECLVPEKISRDCITSIHVYNDPETISTVQHLIDNSGDNSELRINLKTIDRYQTSIKRE